MPKQGALRRDLGTLESYAALVGILIGAGIFKVTSQAWSLTGPSVILGYVVLAPAILATSVPYAVFLSTPLGREPGGEYTHISRTFGGYGVAFVGVWLKVISYVGALAFLATGFADYVARLFVGTVGAAERLSFALASLAFFYLVHVAGVRWFGRLQVAMCALLGVAIAVLVIPGLAAIRPAHYRPFFTHGAMGFLASLQPLFFAYAGFESLAQTAGEVKDSTTRLPGVFLRGILFTTAIYVLMSAVAFGVLPGEHLGASDAPMADVGSVYLSGAAAWFVTLGAVMALSTSLNSTFLVPSRLALVLVNDGLAPAWLGAVSPRTGTPIRGLTLTFLASVALLVSGQVGLALNIAVFALVVLCFIHSLAALVLPRLNPDLFASVTTSISRPAQVAAAILSLGTMTVLVALQLSDDLTVLARLSFHERLRQHALTTLELCLAWAAIGALLYALGPRGRTSSFVRNAAQSAE